MGGVLLPLAVFGITWLLITGWRVPGLPLGRVGGALGGAVAMIAIGAITPAEAYAAIDHDTLALLLGMMLITASLDRAGVLDGLATRILARRGSGFGLLVLTSLVAAVASALLVNDTVCVFLTPVVVAACRRGRLPYAPFLIALATSANLGSAATLVGNPQNMIIGSQSGISFARYAAICGPAAALAFLGNVGLLALFYRRQLPAIVEAPPEAQERVRHAPILIGVLVGVAFAFVAGLHMGTVALAGAVIIAILEGEEPRAAIARVDGSLLLFFASLFVVVNAVDRTGAVAMAWRAIAPFAHLDGLSGVSGFAGAVVIGSNIVSNVPLVLLIGPHLKELGEPTVAWPLLGFISTIAGNLTLVGSVANLIVAERARDSHILGFWEYLRFGAASTALSLVLGVPAIVAMALALR